MGQARQRGHEVALLSEVDEAELEQLSRSSSAPAAWVTRAKAIEWVRRGTSYVEAARQIGQKDGRGVQALVKRFNVEGLEALRPRHGGGYHKYTDAEYGRIIAEAARPPRAETDGTNHWSLTSLQQALREAPDGLPEVSTETIGRVLHNAGFSWQADRTWCRTGEVQRVRKAGLVTVMDVDAEAKKKQSSRRIR